MIDESPRSFIQVDQLSRDYRVGGCEVHALREVSLQIEQGEFLVVAGVSGSGKSTLLHLIGGLDSPSAGRIRIGNQVLGTMTSYQRSIYRRCGVGFIFQSFHLVPSLSAQWNVQMALTFQGVYGRQRHRLASEALNRVGLADRAHHRPGQLSGGEQQRVCVARAIVHRPPLLLADEPTANLDRQTAIDLLDLIRQINQTSGTTVVLVSHDEELLSGYCDRMVRLRDGRLVD